LIGIGPNNDTDIDPPYPDPQAGGYKGNRQCGVYKPTNVISISYGVQEFDLPDSYKHRQCHEYLKLGMQGISVVVSAGDAGVAGPPGGDSVNGCLGNGTGIGTIFNPTFPAACPWVTTLGATYLPKGSDVKKDEEIAVTRFPSGGGFSNYFAIPKYQKDAVENYLNSHTPPYPSYGATNDTGAGIYNRTGRGYPDFSAVGDNIIIFSQGRPLLKGGTSASAPAFAGILTRINEERISAGKSTLGFVNPTLVSSHFIVLTAKM
jgi:tripeptidyl-peptidase-1